MSAAVGSIGWFAGHELRLGWRDWIAMATGGHRTRGIILGVVLVAFALLFHGMAHVFIAPWAEQGITPDKQTLVLITGSAIMIGLGIIGTYVSRIYNEVKGRPRYLVRDRIES